MKILIFILFLSPDTLWTRTYGGSGNETANCIQRTSDGGYIIAGYTESFGSGGKDVYLIKTDDYGNILWAKTYGGAGNEVARCVQETQDSGYIIAGYTASFGGGGKDIYVIKTDINGDSLWTRTYGDSLDQEGYWIEEINGEYVITGYTIAGDSFLTVNVCVLKIDSLGNTILIRDYGAPFDTIEIGFCVKKGVDGGYIIGGMEEWLLPQMEYVYHLYLLKISENGDSIWTNLLGRRQAFYIEPLNDGYIVAGEYIEKMEFITIKYPILIRTDFIGDTIWSQTYPEFGASLKEVKPLPDGGFIAAGGYTGNMWILRTDQNGDTIWTKTIGGSGNEDANSLVVCEDGYVIAGNTNSLGAGGYDVYLVKIASDVKVKEFKISFDKGKIRREIIFDVTGRKIKQNLKKGSYFLMEDEGNKNSVKKIIRIK